MKINVHRALQRPHLNPDTHTQIDKCTQAPLENITDSPFKLLLDYEVKRIFKLELHF